MQTQVGKNLTKDKKSRADKKTVDTVLLIVILLLAAFGIIMVYSASYHYSMVNMNKPSYFGFKQLTSVALGIVVMLIVAYNISYRIFSNMKIAWLCYLVSLTLSTLVLFIGETTKGATRWISIGGFRFQPSELAKIAVVILLSAYIVKHRKEMHKLKYLIRAWLIVLVPTGLIAIENLSSAIVIFLIGTAILFVASPKVWYYLLLIALGVVMVVSVYFLAMNTDRSQEIDIPVVGKILKQYRLDRIRVWQDPWLDPKGKGYQPIQSLFAVGSGGIFGVGLGKGVQKLGFLPEPHNDIIFAVICEELGLVGAIVVLLVYSILVLRGLIIAIHAYDYFGTLVAVGISSMIGIQVLINVAVNTNTIPTTGMQLPLISYGGTAVVVLLGGLGILLNISKLGNLKTGVK